MKLYLSYFKTKIKVPFAPKLEGGGVKALVALPLYATATSLKNNDLCLNRGILMGEGRKFPPPRHQYEVG